MAIALDRCELRPARGGSGAFTMGRHVVRVLETHHKVPSVGYCVGEVRRALEAEFRELDGRVIATLRSNGTVVDEVVHHPRFVYTGDTSPDALTGDVFEKVKLDNVLVWAAPPG